MDYGLFGQNHASILLLTDKIILKHTKRKKSTNSWFCSSPFWKRKRENLKKVAYCFKVAINSDFNSPSVTRDIRRQVWYTRVVINHKTGPFFSVSVNTRTFFLNFCMI